MFQFKPSVKGDELTLSFKPHKLVYSNEIEKALKDKQTAELNNSTLRLLVDAEQSIEEVSGMKLLNSIIDLKMVENPDRDPTNANEVQFTYSVQSIQENDRIIIKIDFENPSAVSMTKNFDRLRVKLKKAPFEKAFIVFSGSGEPIPLPEKGDNSKIDTFIPVPLLPPKNETLVSQAN